MIIKIKKEYNRTITSIERDSALEVFYFVLYEGFGQKDKAINIVIPSIGSLSPLITRNPNCIEMLTG